MMTVDSLCVKGLIGEKFPARENRALATLLCHMWKVTQKELQLHIRWVREHSGDAGNSIAGELTDLGTRVEAQHRRWKRIQPMGDWEEDVIELKMSSLQREKTPSEQALRIRWTGAVNFPRSDPILQGTDSTFGSRYECNCICGWENGVLQKKNKK